MSDFVEGRLPAVARYHLAPGIRAINAGNGAWIIREGDNDLASARILRGRASLAPTQHAAGFGVLVPAQTLEVQLDAGHSIVHWDW